MKTVDASRPGISVFLIGIGIALYVISMGVLIVGFGDLATSNTGVGEIASGASGFIFASLIIGLAAVITRLHSIDAHLKAYVLHETEPPVIKESLTA